MTDEPYFSKEKEVYAVYCQNIANALKRFDAVYADSTCLTQKSRALLIKKIKELYKDNFEINAIYMNTPLSTCLERNAKRTGRARVPETSIREMWIRLEVPTKKEGFNRIFIVEPAGKRGWVTYYGN